MTNPISKAIVKAAVAMGYGKKSDYKGSSVAEVLEKFASIAKDKGSSSGGGGGMTVIEATRRDDGAFLVADTSVAELIPLIESGAIIKANMESGGASVTFVLYPSTSITSDGFNAIVAANFFQDDNGGVTTYYMGTDGSDTTAGSVVFMPMV